MPETASLLHLFVMGEGRPTGHGTLQRECVIARPWSVFTVVSFTFDGGSHQQQGNSYGR